MNALSRAPRGVLMLKQRKRLPRMVLIEQMAKSIGMGFEVEELPGSFEWSAGYRRLRRESPRDSRI